MILVYRTEDLKNLKKALSGKQILILGILLAYPFLQSLPLPLSWLASISPRRFFWLDGAQSHAEISFSSASISYMPIETLSLGIGWLFLFCYAACLSGFIQDKKQYRWFIGMLFAIAVSEALYGFLQVLVPSVGVFWEQGAFPGRSGQRLARGTFINRNHFAAFMGLIWPVLLAHLMGLGEKLENQKKFSKTWSSEKREALWQIRQRQILMAVLVGMVIFALFFSLSRGGILTSLIALSLFMVLAGIRRKGAVCFVAGCWLVMLYYGSIIGFGEILNRFDLLTEDYGGRFAIWKETLSIIRDHPLTGTGLGSYPIVNQAYQTHLPDTQWLGHAHNDYLELASELGLPMTLLLTGCAWGSWWKGVIRLHHSKNDLPYANRLTAAGSLAGMAAFLLHSWVEFNWQIPANQLCFVTILVLAFDNLRQVRSHDESRISEM